MRKKCWHFSFLFHQIPLFLCFLCIFTIFLDIFRLSCKWKISQFMESCSWLVAGSLFMHSNMLLAPHSLWFSDAVGAIEPLKNHQFQQHTIHNFGHLVHTQFFNFSSTMMSDIFFSVFSFRFQIFTQKALQFYVQCTDHIDFMVFFIFLNNLQLSRPLFVHFLYSMYTNILYSNTLQNWWIIGGFSPLFWILFRFKRTLVFVLKTKKVTRVYSSFSWWLLQCTIVKKSSDGCARSHLSQFYCSSVLLLLYIFSDILLSVDKLRKFFHFISCQHQPNRWDFSCWCKGPSSSAKDLSPTKEICHDNTWDENNVRWTQPCTYWSLHKSWIFTWEKLQKRKTNVNGMNIETGKYLIN